MPAVATVNGIAVLPFEVEFLSLYEWPEQHYDLSFSTSHSRLKRHRAHFLSS